MYIGGVSYFLSDANGVYDRSEILNDISDQEKLELMDMFKKAKLKNDLIEKERKDRAEFEFQEMERRRSEARELAKMQEIEKINNLNNIDELIEAISSPSFREYKYLERPIRSKIDQFIDCGFDSGYLSKMFGCESYFIQNQLQIRFGDDYIKIKDGCDNMSDIFECDEGYLFFEGEKLNGRRNGYTLRDEFIDSVDRITKGFKNRLLLNPKHSDIIHCGKIYGSRDIYFTDGKKVYSWDQNSLRPKEVLSRSAYDIALSCVGNAELG